MKEAKTVGITVLVVVLVLLVAGLGYRAVNGDTESVTAQQKLAVSQLKERIGQLKVMREEQTLTRDILVLQQEIRELNLKAQAPPVIEGEFIPIDKLPKEMQE